MAEGPYSKAVTNVFAQKAYGPIYSSAYADSQRSAQANELATRLGISRDIVEADYPNMLAEDRLQRRMAEVRKNAAYAQIMSNWDFAKAAIDDDHLPKIAAQTQQHTTELGLFSGARAYAKSLWSGVPSTSAAFYGLGAAGLEQLAGQRHAWGDLPGDATVRSWLMAGASKLTTLQRQTSQQAGAMVETTNSQLFNYALQGNQSLVPSVTGLIGAGITRNPAVAGYFMAGVTGGQAYGQAREAGLDPNRAASYAAQQALIEGLAETVAGRVFGHSIAQGTGFAKAVGKQVLTEVATEVPTTLLQSASTYTNIGMQKGQSAADWAKGLPEEALATAVGVVSSAGLMTATALGGTHVVSKFLDRRFDKTSLRSVDQIMQAAAQSPTRATNPSGFQEAVSSLVADNDAEHLYVPAEQVRALFQSEDGEGDISQDPFWSRYAGQIKEAEALGGDVVIPLADAATHLAGTPQWQQLRDHVRTRPGGASMAEARKGATPEELAAIADELGRSIDQSAANAQLMTARQSVGRWAEKMGFAGPQAQAVNRMLSSALATRWQGEAEKAAAAGEQAPSMEEFAAAWLPEASKTTQTTGAEFSAAASMAGRIAEKAKAGTLTSADAAEFLDAAASDLNNAGYDVAAADLATGEASEGGSRAGKGGDRSSAIPSAEPRGEAPAGQLGGASPQVLNQADGRLTFYQSEPVADLEGNEIAPAGTPLSEVRKAATAFYRRELLAHTLVAVDGRTIRFNLRGLKKTTRAGEDLLRLVPAIPAVLQSGEYLGAESPREKSDTGTKAYHRYAALVTIGSEEVPTLVVVRETNDGSFQYSLHRRLGVGSQLEAGGDTAGADIAPALEGAPDGKDIGQDEHSLKQRARGAIQILPDAQGLMKAALISAYEAANFSTAVHELGHFFLEDLRSRAVRGNATEQERADWQTFRDWAAELGHPVGDIGPIPVDAHEYFARGMERYVFEGQAPSKGLRALFFRMRDFMLDLYRTAMAFNSPITPEIRQVMGRMLASDQEVAEQAEAMKLASAAVGDLLSETERQEYDGLAEDAREDARGKLYERMLTSLRAEKKAEVRDRRNEIRTAVAEEVDAEPRFRALSLLRGGIPQEDGTKLKVRLPREWLIQTYGEDAESRLPKSVPPIVSDTDAANPDQVAGMAGYDNADAMIRDLFALEADRQASKDGGDKRSPRQRLIEDETQRRLDAEMGDPMANLEEEAQAALASDRQADLMSLELRALARKTGRKPTAWALAKQWAAERVQGETTRDALSGRTIQQHARAAAKAGANAEEALVNGDFEAAFKAKQQQLLNMALLAESKNAKEAVDKAARRLQRIGTRDTIPSVEQDYLDQAHQLLEDVDLRARSQTAIDKRLAFEEWYLAEVAAGREPVVPASYRSLLGKTHWTRLPVDELLELDKAVGQIVELGRLKKRLKDGKVERDFDEAVAELEATALAGRSRKRTRDNDPNRTMLARAKSRIRAVDAAMVKVETMTRWLDGGKANGPWQRMIFGPMAEAQGREDDLKATYIDRINGLVKGLPKATLKGWEQLVDTPELTIQVPGHPNVGEPWQFTKDQVVMMAMNWGNEGNQQRLLDGFGWGEAEVQAVFDRLLTKEDWDFVQGVWDTVEGLWPEIEALERRVNGVAPEKVEAQLVPTRHGTYMGGYFPAVYDPTYSTRAELDDASKLSPSGAWFQATTRASATKARAAAVSGRPLLLSMSVITRHLGEVIHDVTHREAVVQVRKLMKDGRVRNAIEDQLGPEYRRAMDGWLENIAAPNIADGKMNPTLVALARHLNKGVSMVGLGFRLSTVLLQPLGLANTAKEIGAARVAEGMATFVAHPVETYREVTRRSAEMRNRFNTMDASIEAMVGQANSGRLQVIGPKGLAKYAFHGILYADMLVTVSGWSGAFNKGLAEGMNEDEAGAYADSVIRTTQGAGGNKDRSAILYENSFAKTFWPFFSYLNALYNQQRDIGRQAVRIRSSADAFDVLKQAWWVAIVPPLVQALLMGEGPDDDKDDPENWARYLTRSVMLGNLSSLPLVGPIGNALGSGFGYRSNAWQTVGEGLVKGWKDLQHSAEEGEPVKGSTVQSVINTLGVLSAQPLGQPAATARGAYDWATGQETPQDAGDAFELLTKGRVSKKPTAAERLMGEKAE